MKTLRVATGAVSLTFTGAGPAAMQSRPTRLTLELQDCAALPITADNNDANTRSQRARKEIWAYGFDGRLSDDEIRGIVNYLRSLSPKR